MFRLLSTVQTRAELEDGMNTLLAGRDFVYVTPVIAIVAWRH